MPIKPTSDAWLIRPKPNPQASLRLFCFPYAGGSSMMFRTWQDSLPEGAEVCAVELPGRGTRFREKPFTKLTPLVEAIAPAILPYLDRPFAFSGHSMGALVSFELTRLLRKQYDRLPAHLFVSARHAPHFPDAKLPIHALPEAAFIQELRHLNGTPEEILENAELMQLFLPVLRADFAVLETYTYTPEAPLGCPISVFGGLQDTEVSYEKLKAWRQQTIASFSLQLFPGDHFFVSSAQPLLLQALSKSLT